MHVQQHVQQEEQRQGQRRRRDLPHAAARTSRHRWKALPKRDFLRSLVVSVLTGFRLKL